jgi:succinylarginine dihydrolase
MDLLLVGLPGPTHSFGGLSPGNLASKGSKGTVAHPQAAARQVLGLMRTLVELGQPVGFLPPLPRPDLAFLAACGFAGDPAEALGAAAREAPTLLAAALSSAACWTANCATVNADVEGPVRLLVANLAAMPHRMLEAGPRFAQLRMAFDPLQVAVEGPVPAHVDLADEGAANHHRVVGPKGICHIFVHGRAEGLAASALPKKHPARQARAASVAAARRLGLANKHILHVRQHPLAIDGGAFHNDVLMVGAEDRLLIHECAWVDQREVFTDLERRCGRLRVAVVSTRDLPLAEAIRCYLFNSQLIKVGTEWVLVAPEECAGGDGARTIARLKAEGFIQRAVTVPVRESMLNGGGPACLRLRVPVGIAALAPGLRVDAAALDRLDAWVVKHYRERLAGEELADPALVGESAAALAELAALTGIATP